MSAFDLIGRVIVAIVVLWIVYGTVVLTFFAKALIPNNAPWSARLCAGAMFVAIAGWVLIRHQRVLRGFIMQELNAETGEVLECPCPNCQRRRANG